jgi:hypothetical protein
MDYLYIIIVKLLQNKPQMLRNYTFYWWSLYLLIKK